MIYKSKEKNIFISAKNIEIGTSAVFGDNINIKVKDKFKLGDCCYLGNNTNIIGRNVTVGDHFYTSGNLRIGGGGAQNPDSNLIIGDRCTMHNSFINICKPVTIGNDVGFSHHVDIITHGFWSSVLEGYPASFSGVKVGNNVIIGYRSVILMGVHITDDIVIGAHSVINKNLDTQGIYVGSPAKYIKEITPLTKEGRVKKIEEIIANYYPIAEYHSIKPFIRSEYPLIRCNDFLINVETFKYWGEEDKETDDFRDYLRKYGIRIYTKRLFKSNFSF